MESLTCAGALVQSFLDDCAENTDLSPSTIKAYGDQLRWYTEWLDGRPLNDIRPRDVEEFGRRPARNGQRSAASTRQSVVVVRKFHAWCVEIAEVEGIRRVDMARAPRVKKGIPKPIPDEQWLKLWESALDPQDRLWLGLAFYCGMRRREIVTIPPHAVNPESGYMWFVRKGGREHPIEHLAMVKTVEIKLPHLAKHLDEFVEVLHETAQFRGDKSWPTLWWDVGLGPLRDSERLNKRLYKLLAAAGLPSRLFTPHQMRHSCATNLHRCGVDLATISNLMGHSNTTITMNYTKTVGSLGAWCDQQIPS